MDGIKALHDLLVKGGYYTKSVDDFRSQIKNPQYVDKVQSVLQRDGIWSDEMADVLASGGVSMQPEPVKKKEQTMESSSEDGSLGSQGLVRSKPFDLYQPILQPENNEEEPVKTPSFDFYEPLKEKKGELPKSFQDIDYSEGIGTPSGIQNLFGQVKEKLKDASMEDITKLGSMMTEKVKKGEDVFTGYSQSSIGKVNELISSIKGGEEISSEDEQYLKERSPKAYQELLSYAPSGKQVTQTDIVFEPAKDVNEVARRIKSGNNELSAKDAYDDVLSISKQLQSIGVNVQNIGNVSTRNEMDAIQAKYNDALKKLQEEYPEKMVTQTWGAKDFGGKAVYERAKEYYDKVNELNNSKEYVMSGIGKIHAIKYALANPNASVLDVGAEALKVIDPTRYKNYTQGGSVSPDVQEDIDKLGYEILKSTGNKELVKKGIDAESMHDKRYPNQIIEETKRRIAIEYAKDKGTSYIYNPESLTISETDKYVDQLPSKYKKAYLEKIRPYETNQGGVRAAQVFTNEPIPASVATMAIPSMGGAVNKFFSGVLMPIEGGFSFVTDRLNPESTVINNALKKDYRQLNVDESDVKKKISEIQSKPKITIEEAKELEALRAELGTQIPYKNLIDGTAELTGQVVGQALMTELGTAPVSAGLRSVSFGSKLINLTDKAAKIAKLSADAEKMKTLSAAFTSGISSYSDAQKEAINLGLEGWKQNLYSATVAGLNVATEHMFPDHKVFEVFMKDASPLVAKMVRDMSTNNITQAALNDNLKNLFLDLLPRYAKNVAIENQKEAFEEVATQLGTSITKALLAPDKTNLSDEMKAIEQTYYETTIYGGVTSSLAALKETKANSIKNKSLYQLGASPEKVQQFIDVVNSKVSDGTITQKEADEKIKAVTDIKNIVQNSIPEIDKRKPLTDAEKIKLSSILLAERKLKEDINNPQLEDVKSINQKELNKVVDAKEKILNNEVVIDNDLNTYTQEEYNQKAKQDAIQEQTAGQVPVQPTTGVGEKMEEGVPQPKPEKPAQKVKKELPEGVTITDAVDEDGEPDYDAEDALRALAKKRGIGITSDRQVAQVARDADGNVIGGTFTSYDNVDGKYTFDVVVDEAYEGKGIGSNLLDVVKNVPSDIAEMNPDAKVEVDVVNPAMQKMLESRGFEVTKQLGEGRVLMEPKSEQQETVSSMTPESKNITFMDNEGNEHSIEGNESLLADLYEQAIEVPMSERTMEQQSVVDAMDEFSEDVSPTTPPVSMHDEEQANAFEQRVKEPEKKKLVSLAKTVINSLKSIFGDIEFNIHEDERSYNKAVSKLGGKAGSAGNFIANNDGKIRIDINLNKANARTVGHEAAHAVLHKLFGENKRAFKAFHKQLSKVISSMGDQDFIGNRKQITTVKSHLNSFIKRYQGELKESRSEEYAVELGGILTDNAANLSVSGWRKIALMVRDFVSRVTDGKIKLFENVNDTKDIVDFFNSMAQSFKTGEAIKAAPESITKKFGKAEAEKQDVESLNDDFAGEMYEQGNLSIQGKLDSALPSTGRKSAPSLTGDEEKTERDELVERNVIDKETLVGATYSVTMSDHTKVGSYNNTKTGVKVDNLMGGVMFPYIKGIYDAGMAWASTGVKQARELISHSIGQDYTLIYRMARSTGSRGNANFNQIAFAELTAPVTQGKVSEKVFLKQLNEKLNGTFSRKNKETNEIETIKQNEIFANILSKVGTKTRTKIELKSNGESTFVNRIEIKSLNELGKFLENAAFGVRGNFWSTILKNDDAKATLPWYKFLEKYNVQTIKGIVDAIAEVETDAANDHDIVGALKIEPQYTENGLIKVFTPHKELVNEAKGVFYVDAPKHPSYKYYVPGKPVGILNEFNSVTEYFPIIAKWMEEGRLNSPYKAVETMGKEISESTRSKSKASLVHDETGFVSTDFWVNNLRGNTKYLDDVIKNILDAREELKRGEVKEDKVIKSYLITLASMGSGGGYYKKWADKTGKKISDIFLEKSNGKDWIRPEGSAAAYLVTSDGKKLIKDVSNGTATPEQVKKMFDFVGIGKENQKTAYVIKTIANGGIKSMTDLFNKNKGSDFEELYKGAIKNLEGIGEGKTGFFNQYFGVASRGVVDARQLNAWVGGSMKLTPEQKEMAKKVSQSKKLSDQLLDRIKQVGIELGYSEDLAGYIAHHAIWDAIKNSITRHEGEYAVVSGKYTEEDKKLIKAISKSSLVGGNANLAEDIVNNKKKAIAFEKLGMSPEKIRLLTDWEKGGDGKWRYELDSSKSKMKIDFKKPSDLKKPIKLSEIISYPELFDAYPELKDVNIVFEDGDPRGAYHNYDENEIGLYYDKDMFKSLEELKKAPNEVIETAKKYIKIMDYEKQMEKDGIDIISNEYFEKLQEFKNSLNYDENILVKNGYADLVDKYYGRVIVKNKKFLNILNSFEDRYNLNSDMFKSNLLHEIQHAIQNIEGFSLGGNSIIAANLMNRQENSEYNKITWAIVNLKKEMKRKGLSTADLTDEEIRTLVSGKSFLHKIYKRIAGEVEARNVEERRNMTAEERRATPLTATEDVPRSEFKFREKMKSKPSLADEADGKNWKSKIYKEVLDAKDINSLRASLRKKAPNSYTLDILDEIANGMKNNEGSEDPDVDSFISEGITLSNIKNMLIEDDVFDNPKDVDNYFVSIGGQGSKGIFNRLSGAKSTPVSKAQLSEEELPGYDDMMSEVKGIAKKVHGRQMAKLGGAIPRGTNLDNTKYKKERLQAALDFVMQQSKVYEDANDVQRDQIIRDIRKMLGFKEKSAPGSASELFMGIGRIIKMAKEKKMVTMTQTQFFYKQLNTMLRGGRDAEKAINRVKKEISESLRGYVSTGKLSSKQAAAIVRMYGKTNLLKPESVQRLIDYMAKVFSDADYTNKLSIAKKLKSKIAELSKDKKKNPHLRDMAKKFISIDPSLVDDIEEYNKIANNILSGISGSTISGSKVKWAEGVNILGANNYINTSIESQDKKKRDMLASEMEELFGIDVSDMTYEDLKLLIENKEKKTSKYNKPLIRSLLNRVFGINKAVLESMMKNGEDPFTGYPVTFTEQQKDILKRFLAMDLDMMTEKDALNAIDMINLFLSNQGDFRSTAGMESVVKAYEGEKNLRQLIKQKVIAPTIRKYFSPALGKLLLEQTVSIPMMFERLFKGVQRGANVQDKMGVTDTINGKARAERMSRKIDTEYVLKFFNKKANGEKFNTARNNIERGMAAFMMRNVVGTEQQMKDEFERRRGHIEKSIELLKNGNEQEQEKAEMYQEAYDKIVKDSKNIQDIESKIDPTNLEAIKWWSSKWDEHYDEMASVAANVYNKLLDKDINYNPDRYKRISTDTDIVNLNNDESVFDFNNGTIYKKEAGSLLEAQRLTPLPTNEKTGKPNRYIDFSFDNNNSNAMYDALVDIKTAASIRQINAFINSDNFYKLFKSNADGDIVKDRIKLMVDNIRNKSTFTQRDELGKLIHKLNRVASIGVGQALGGFSQPLKQVIPVGLNTLLNAGGRLHLGFVLDPTRKKFLDESGYSIANRGEESSTQIESLNKLIEQAANSKGEAAMRKIEELNKLQLKIFLVNPDLYIARASWLAYYEQSLKRQGIKNFNYANDKINKKAADYAQMMVDRQQNISDHDLAGKLYSQRGNDYKNFFVKLFAAFSSFRMNSASRLANDLSVFEYWNTSTVEDKKIAIRSLAGYAVEATTFRLISFYISSIMQKIVNEIRGTDDDDEEDEKKQSYNLKGQVTTGVTETLSPFPLLDKAVQFGVYQTLDLLQSGDEKDKINIYNAKADDIIKSLGMFGIAADKAIVIGQLAKLGSTGKFVDDYGRTKYLKESDKDVANALILPSILSGIGIIPASDINQVTRKAIKDMKKDASTNNPEELTLDEQEKMDEVKQLEYIEDNYELTEEQEDYIDIQIQKRNLELAPERDIKEEKRLKQMEDEKKESEKNLLGEYKSKTQMKKFDPELYEENFGENSDWAEEYKAENDVKKLWREIKKTKKWDE